MGRKRKKGSRTVRAWEDTHERIEKVARERGLSTPEALAHVFKVYDEVAKSPLEKVQDRITEASRELNDVNEKLILAHAARALKYQRKGHPAEKAIRMALEPFDTAEGLLKAKKAEEG